MAGDRTGCFGNITNSTDFTPDPRQIELLDAVFHLYFGWLALPIASLGLFMSVSFIASVLMAMIRKRVSRKCYILLLDRAVADVVACCTALSIVVYILSTKHVNPDVMAIAETMLIGSFWTAMVSYVSLSLLKLFAVARPLEYRGVVTMRRCIYLIMISWSFYAVIVFGLFTMMALVRFETLNNWSGCRVETCIRNAHRVRHVLIILSYFLTISSFLGTVLYVNRAQHFINSFRRKEAHKPDRLMKFPLWKLGLNVATFGCLYIFQVGWSAFILFNRNNCLFVLYKIETTRLHGIIRNTLLLRIVVDPVISFLTDYQLRRGIFELLEHCFGIKMKADSRIFVQYFKEESTGSTSETQKSPNVTITKNRPLKITKSTSCDVRL